MSSELLRYIGAGMINTLVGYLAFLIVLRGFATSVEAANVISYACGLACAYLLNRRFVFRAQAPSPSAPWKFAAGFALAFAVNASVLRAAIGLLGLAAEAAQLLAMAAYTITFYLINKYVVFAGGDKAA